MDSGLRDNPLLDKGGIFEEGPAAEGKERVRVKSFACCDSNHGCSWPDINSQGVPRWQFDEHLKRDSDGEWVYDEKEKT